MQVPTKCNMRLSTAWEGQPLLSNFTSKVERLRAVMAFSIWRSLPSGAQTLIPSVRSGA